MRIVKSLDAEYWRSREMKYEPCEPPSYEGFGGRVVVVVSYPVVSFPLVLLLNQRRTPPFTPGTAVFL